MALMFGALVCWGEDLLHPNLWNSRALKPKTQRLKHAKPKALQPPKPWNSKRKDEVYALSTTLNPKPLNPPLSTQILNLPNPTRRSQAIAAKRPLMSWIGLCPA